MTGLKVQVAQTDETSRHTAWNIESATVELEVDFRFGTNAGCGQHSMKLLTGSAPTRTTRSAPTRT